MVETNSRSPLEIISSLPDSIVDVRNHSAASVEASGASLKPSEAIQIGAPAVKVLEGLGGEGILTYLNGDQVETTFNGSRPKSLKYKINTNSSGTLRAA